MVPRNCPEGQPGPATQVLADAEVDEVDVVGVGAFVAALDEEVARLDVAVDQAAAVGGVQGAGGLLEQKDGGVGLEAAALLEHLPQVGPGHAAHGDVEQSVA